MTEQARKYPNIFEAKREFLAYRPTDAVSNQNRVDSLP